MAVGISMARYALTAATWIIFAAFGGAEAGSSAESTAALGATNDATAHYMVAFKGVGDARPAVWTVTPSSSGDGSWSIAVDVPGISASTCPDGVILHIPGEARGEPGTPAVPRLARLLPGIPGRTPHLTVQGLMPTNVAHLSLAPVEGHVVPDRESPTPHLEAVRRPSAEIYGRSEFWPAELGTIHQAQMGTQIVVRVECFPVQYNPGRGCIRFYRRLEGRVTFEPERNTQMPRLTQ